MWEGRGGGVRKEGERHDIKGRGNEGGGLKWGKTCFLILPRYALIHITVALFSPYTHMKASNTQDFM